MLTLRSGYSFVENRVMPLTGSTMLGVTSFEPDKIFLLPVMLNRLLLYGGVCWPLRSASIARASTPMHVVCVRVSVGGDFKGGGEAKYAYARVICEREGARR